MDPSSPSAPTTDQRQSTRLRSNELTLVTPHRSTIERFTLVWRYRELLAGLVRKELKVRYKGSALGFVWSLLNPVLYLVVYYFVFEVILQSGITNFPIWLLSGLLPWTLFASSLVSATVSITGNGSLVKKVYFPREVLPLASVGASLIHFLLQSIVLVVALIAFRWSVAVEYLWLVPIALLVLLLLAATFAIFVAAVNVKARDTQHLLELSLLAWFWLTPIVYPYMLTASRLGSKSSIMLLNPMTSIVTTFQRAIYGRTTGDPTPGGGRVALLPPDASPLWYLRNLAIVAVITSVVLVLALKLFDRLEGGFAEEV
jgi:ABC-2 type transport system permease protein